MVVKKGVDNLSPMDDDEFDRVEQASDFQLNSRLGCQAIVKGDVVVSIPAWTALVFDHAGFAGVEPELRQRRALDGSDLRFPAGAVGQGLGLIDSLQRRTSPRRGLGPMLLSSRLSWILG